MQKKRAAQSGFFNPRILVAFALCSAGAFLAMLSLAATLPTEAPRVSSGMPLAAEMQGNWAIVN
ncbi:MAG: hypothetical protein QOK02_6552, partial [Mycobacterium sp.]|nr:hypothetical protein [Mycobacterium sp.]